MAPKFRFNALFRPGGDGSLNACVGDNGGRYDLFDYAHGYFAATRKILEAAKVVEGGLAVDTLVYPACYNFRHSLELFIKYLVTSYARLLKDDSIQFETRHGLKGNWDKVQAAAMRYRWAPFKVDEIGLVEATIADFHEVDPNGVIFRYPDSIKGEQHLKDWALINLGVIEEHATRLFEMFEDWHYRIDERLHPES